MSSLSQFNHRLALVALVTLATGCPTETPSTWTSAFDASEGGWLMNVAARAPNDVWAVGGEPSFGVVRHFDGTTWSDVPVPSGVPLLDWAMPWAADDALVVGSSGTVLRWNGLELELVTSGTDANLWGVWGASPDDAWIVGGSGFSGSSPVLLHYDGDHVEPVTLPAIQRSNVFAFYKVWGSGPRDVWVVGQSGVVLHYDGATWTEQLVGVSDDLIAVWGTGPEHVVMVGGRSNGVIVTWDGAAFHATALAPLPGLNGVWFDDDARYHVVGIEGTLATIDAATLAWEQDASDVTRLTYHSISGDETGRLWAVGGNIGASHAPYKGLASTRQLLPSER